MLCVDTPRRAATSATGRPCSATCLTAATLNSSVNRALLINVSLRRYYEAKMCLVNLGRFNLPMNSQSRYNLFQLINSLYEYRSIILTTNKNFASWAEFFHNDAVAVPIVDRIIHHSHLFMLGGESYRLKAKMKDI